MAEEQKAAEPLWRDVLGRRLRDLRRERGETLTETAQRAGISPQYLSEIERGRKECSSEILGSVAEALGLDLIDVVHRVGERLGAQLDEDRRAAERHERLVLETELAFRVDVMPEHRSSLLRARADDAGVLMLAA